MKKLGFKAILLFPWVFLFYSCDGFIPDPIDPRLPVYSESGKNQSGAMINNIPYVDYPNYSIFGSESSGYLLNQADTSLIFNFYLADRNKENAFVNIFFSLDKLTQTDWEEMEKGFGKKFKLDSPNIKGKIITYLNQGDLETPAESGQITVKYIPGSNALAGTFGFTTSVNSVKKYEVRFGRFDYIFQRN
jgi:hypothetical protein